MPSCNAFHRLGCAIRHQRHAIRKFLAREVFKRNRHWPFLFQFRNDGSLRKDPARYTKLAKLIRQ
jgi:hypothetical protein